MPKGLCTLFHRLPFVNAAMETKCFENFFMYLIGKSYRLFPHGFYNGSDEEPSAMTTHSISLCISACDF